MKTVKGPAIFLAQFVGDEEPFNDLISLCKWAKSLGYKGVQIPTWETGLIDVKKLAESKTFADEYKGKIEETGVVITELASHLIGQLVAVHPAYDTMFDAFAPEELHGKPKERQEWAIQQLKYTAKASKNLGLDAHITFSGALMWHTVYPWPQRPAGLVEDGFAELAKLWKPILDEFDENGVDVCYELHPGEDLHDGITYEKFLEATDNHRRARILYDPSHFVLQQLDYLEFIDIYKDYIEAFHVKDAEFNPTGRAGVYGGYESWIDRPGRFRSIGDGQVDFRSIFTKLSQYDIDCWAVLEWECCIKHPEQGAKEGAELISDYIIQVTEKAFDDFAGGGGDTELNKKILGIE
ncbi:sugar phosphate isomerase/epimerase family protein [Rhodohalobacter sulfatireducens]|uniref:Sugar phosphate isomerase/epimerase n=1 Tax=Rhodohalobacter sulfatireducens TaxID=2911366 RepID=A0ABS9KCW9_9BACT|nr:sugar phosphate isomerase/epimerase family protein [Rhodohalobacter sulfatireducens]MCG2588709.1 sugar phosphate isomerase/epimerase [Rhodohalobacter sulfatireducens]